LPWLFTTTSSRSLTFVLTCDESPKSILEDSNLNGVQWDPFSALIDQHGISLTNIAVVSRFRINLREINTSLAIFSDQCHQ